MVDGAKTKQMYCLLQVITEHFLLLFSLKKDEDRARRREEKMAEITARKAEKMVRFVTLVCFVWKIKINLKLISSTDEQILVSRLNIFIPSP